MVVAKLGHTCAKKKKGSKFNIRQRSASFLTLSAVCGIVSRWWSITVNLRCSLKLRQFKMIPVYSAATQLTDS